MHKVVSVLLTSAQGGMGCLLPPMKCSAYFVQQGSRVDCESSKDWNFGYSAWFPYDSRRPLIASNRRRSQKRTFLYNRNDRRADCGHTFRSAEMSNTHAHSRMCRKSVAEMEEELLQQANLFSHLESLRSRPYDVLIFQNLPSEFTTDSHRFFPTVGYLAPVFKILAVAIMKAFTPRNVLITNIRELMNRRLWLDDAVGFRDMPIAHARKGTY